MKTGKDANIISRDKNMVFHKRNKSETGIDKFETFQADKHQIWYTGNGGFDHEKISDWQSSSSDAHEKDK